MGWTHTSAKSWALPLMVAVMGLIGLNAAASARAGGRRAPQPQQQAASGATVRSIGTVESIQGNAIKLKTDSGAEINALIQDSTRMLRIQPGQKSLKDAKPLQLKDLQVGDRVLVAGKTSADEKSLLASSIIAIKHSDIAQRQQQEEEEWQKHGVGGLVKAVDAGTGAITIAANGAGNKTITINTSKDTILRRYAPGSVRFQDAKPGTFAQIKPGDQLRARGVASADGSEIAAAEVVSGSFQNIAGSVVSVDPSANEITVMDLLTKKPVVVKIQAESELRKLPEPTAQEIAMRLKGSKPGTGAAADAHPEPPKTAGPDLDQILRGLPQIAVADLHKGDVVMIVSTGESAASTAVTAIKLVSGVAPILTAAPAKNQAKALQSLWSGFGGTGGGGGSGESGGETPSAPSQ